MAGLLDFMFSNDPNQQAQTALALGLLGGKGDFGGILSGAMGNAQGVYQDAQNKNLQRGLLGMQMQEMQAQTSDRNMQSALRALQARKAEQDEQQRQRAREAFAAKYPQYAPLYDIDPKMAGERAWPKQDDKQSSLAQLIGEMNSLPDGSPLRKIYQDAITKNTTHQPATSVSYGAPVMGINPLNGQPEFFQPGNRGGLRPTGVAPAKDPNQTKDPTESQAKAAAFLGQMKAATSALDSTGGDRASLATQFNVALAGTPANSVASAQSQQIKQAQEQWAEAFLRFKTGAASTEDEVKRNVKTFFPQIGDRPEVIQQKKAMRLNAEKDMEIAAGRALNTPAYKNATNAIGGGNVVDFGSLK